MGTRIESDQVRIEPLRASADGHFLCEADGSPFFWLQDWAYEWFKAPTREQADQYLIDRAHKGFNVIMAPLTGMTDPLSVPNPDGALPFLENDPGQPNPDYFDNVDWIVRRAAHYGIRSALLLTWGDLITGSGGQRQVFNLENAEYYGRWLGHRYQDCGIIWVLGGDFMPLWPKPADPSLQFWPRPADPGEAEGDPKPLELIDYTPIFDAFAKGIVEGSKGTAFITYHPCSSHWPGTPQPRTSLYLGDRSWLDMNMLQSGHHLVPEPTAARIGLQAMWKPAYNYEAVSDEYHSSPTRPVIDGEPRLEDEAINLNPENGYWKAYDIRNANYHALFAGAAGIAYGNVGTGMISDSTPFLAGLQLRYSQAISSLASAQMQHAKALMLSRPYFTRIPDQSIIVGDAGRGEPHRGATRDSEGSYAMIYLPHGLSVTVDMSKLSCTHAIAWWFDPRTGQASRIDGAFPTTEMQTFESPSSGADTDWILVLDDADRGFSPPGMINQ